VCSVLLEAMRIQWAHGRPFHSSTSHLNLSLSSSLNPPNTPNVSHTEC
jgi:hypothetical protein